ncbi:hypothetical protein CVT25_005793 [Psilocybe cyanescens]|uniref:Uncharacterized protein n=1 Tax=Psilocybe cyanescens TaxID=93625 RepID=A0A409VLQ2_PSICY|nr:hypothetical protein CVT25_005793 [Psilocybe cyanescens]
MKFRLSVQPKHVDELKSIAPSLLSDPAFSPDPHSNPYYVLNGEPSIPPVGHPALKSKNRRQPSNFAHSISAADFGFDLIPPPNSPVAPSAIPTTTHFPFPTNNPPSSALRAAASHPPVATPFSAPVASATNTSPKEGKKRRMPFLSRRNSSAQPIEPPRPAASVRQNLLPTRSARADNDVTQRTRPAPAPRNVSEPLKSVKNTESRPALPLRSATVSGASTPTTRTAGKPSAPSQISNSRTQDLDRIDELDETNPWGIALHHGGPYEVAAQALRSANNSTTFGTGGSMLNDYPRQALHAHGNLYTPPQVPTGVSLNLSPGQILPRNFDISPQAQYPRRQTTVGPSSYRQPPSILVPGTPISRRQSQSLPLLSPSPLPNPHPISSPISPRDAPMPKREPQPAPEPKPASEPDRTEAIPFDIGMAMLHPSASASASSIPSIYLHPETSDDSEFDPYDPVHLEREHPRTPSFDSSAEQSRGPSPDPQPQRLIPQPTIFRNAPENPDTLRQQSPIAHDPNTPPPYSDVDLDLQHHLQPTLPIDRSRNSSREPSPGPSSRPSSASHGAHNDEAGHLKPTFTERLPHDTSISSADLRETSSDLYFVAQMPLAQSSREHVHNIGLPSVQDHDARNPHQVAQMPPARSSHEHIHNIRTPALQERDFRSTNQIAQMPPTQSNGEHVQSLGPPPVQDRDTRSTHHTISTYTSSQMRNGPPPHRHIPKHLVMPTPLKNNSNNGFIQNPTQLPPQSFLPTQFGPTQVQVQVRAQPRVPYPQHPPYPQAQQLFAPVQSNSIRPAKLIPSSKLRKKLSTKITPAPATIPPPPIVTTVSFAPPVIGHGQSSASEKLFGRSKAEKIPKRVLSKRRTDF